jgi:hypothetical protein
VPPVPIVNKMTAYRYWFNNDLSKFQTVELPVPADSLMLDTVMLTGIGNGKHAIHFQFRDSLGLWSGATTDSVTVLFYPRPAGPIAGPAKLCLGQGSVTYSVAPIEHAETYVWTLPNGFTGSSDTSFIVVDPATAAMTGSISVYGVNSLGNGAPSSLGVMVSDNPTVSITGDNSLQSGESTTLSAVPSPAGGYAYAWFPGGAETPSITVTPAQTTAYNVTVTDTNTTCSASNTITVDVSLNVRLKVILQGAWSASQLAMTTSLNSGGYLPGTQPYSGAPWNYAGTESLSVLPSNMTDWVLVELRSAPDTVVARRAGILLSDGSVVDTNGQAGLNFAMPAGSYYVAVKHRNHLPLMTESRRDLPDTTTYNFADTANYPVYGRCVISIGSGRSAMISGDVNYDSRLRYSGPQNDRGPILTKILGIVGGSSITASAPGYHAEDLSMNGQIRYSGPGNDPALIIQNIVQLTGSSAINGTFEGSVR